MRFVILSFCLLVSCGLQAACPVQAPVWLTLDITASEPARDEAAEWIEIRRDGCVTSRYASFDTRRGVYQYQLNANETAALATQIAAAGMERFDTAAVRK